MISAALLLLLATDGGAAAPSPKHWLLWREGKQCQLRAKKEVEREKERLGVPAEVWASYGLDPSLLPKECIPKKPFGPPRKAECAACGCREIWYFCAASTEDLSKQGYSRVE